MLAGLLIVTVLGVALAKDVVNLRGAVGEGHGLPYGQQELDLKVGEGALANFIKSIQESEFATNLASGKLLSGTDKDVQNYPGGRPPLLTYKGYITAKKFDQPACGGQATSVAAVAYPCMRSGSNSMTASCFKENGVVTLVAMAFENRNCSGEPVLTQSMGGLGCQTDLNVAMSCVLHDNVPKFAKKEGLVTYKFRATDACQNFASYYLNFYAPVNDEMALGDDLLTLPSSYGYGDDSYGEGNDDGEGEGGGEGYGDGGFGGLDTAERPSKNGHRHQEPQEPQEQQHQQGHKDAGPAHRASNPASTGTQRPDKHLTFVGGDGEAPTREFASTQLFNNVCAYDKKYGLWVRTSCHGRVGKLSHYVFADAECRRPIKRVVHDLYAVLPHYGSCTRALGRSHEVLLTVCHNDIDVPEGDVPPLPVVG